jgi:chromosomal replication initiator protein
MRAIWEQAKKEMRSRLPKNSFSLWINPVNFLETRDKTLILGCPNRFSRNWIMENYLEIIQDGLDKAGAGHLELLLKVNPVKKPQSPPPIEEKQLILPHIPPPRHRGRFCFKTDFTFERFVVGPSNEFAYSASKAIAQGTSWNYQSLIMLAKTGLGKSHLSQAVGQAILEKNPQCRVYYVTAEDFTNEMISSLKNNRIEQFKDKYRRACDVLLLEEIHFLGGKEKTQIELGHTLDALANDNKKLLFTSSLPPQDIPSMSRQLSSRLTSGVVARIDNPDYETRVNILTKKAAEHQVPLPKSIAHFLAGQLNGDIRQMESALKCLKAKSELLKVKIEEDLAKEVLKCFVSRERSITPVDIGELVCRYYKIDAEMLRSKSRKKIYAYPRNIYVYLCRRHTDENLENIAKSIERSHSTVLYASEVVEHKMKSDEKMRKQIDFLTQKLEEKKG